METVDVQIIYFYNEQRKLYLMKISFNIRLGYQFMEEGYPLNPWIQTSPQ